MAEPASSIVGVAAAIGFASLMPGIDANALMGASLGAALVAYNKVDISPLKRLGALAFSATLGYLMSAEVVSLTFVNETGTGAFIGAIAIVPLALKLISVVDDFDLGEYLRKRKGG